MNTQALEDQELRYVAQEVAMARALQWLRSMTWGSDAQPHIAAIVEALIAYDPATVGARTTSAPTELEASKTLLKQALKEANAKLSACEALLYSWDEYNAKHLKTVRQPYTLPVREPAAQLREALRGEA